MAVAWMIWVCVCVGVFSWSGALGMLIELAFSLRQAGWRMSLRFT